MFTGKKVHYTSGTSLGIAHQGFFSVDQIHIVTAEQEQQQQQQQQQQQRSEHSIVSIAAKFLVLLPAYMITRVGRHAAPAACVLGARGYHGALSSVMEGQMANRTNRLIPLFAKPLSHTI
ncbi:hypothetical protein EYF80_017954 [Liparis tanakae]|uniref:Uncharacterized protein n=1 Tax=Liparis tanakae TaxID=230148 RepID=A0A4Z2I3G6_9TELE|nr:hypothetical protein EYF80_017954 [Liparis tanakae]